MRIAHEDAILSRGDSVADVIQLTLREDLDWTLRICGDLCQSVVVANQRQESQRP